MSYGRTREARFKAAQMNMYLMRFGQKPIWFLSYLIKDESMGISSAERILTEYV